MDLNRAVADNIKRIRKSKKLSMERLAAEAGVSRSMLGQIERGEANPSPSVIRWSFEKTVFYNQKANMFRIHEKSKTEASNLNFDLLGNNNIYQGVIGAYSNSFIYSQDNEIGQHVHDCSFLNSDWNEVGNYAKNIHFIDANYNTIYCGQANGTGGHKTAVQAAHFYGSVPRRRLRGKA